MAVAFYDRIFLSAAVIHFFKSFGLVVFEHPFHRQLGQLIERFLAALVAYRFSESTGFFRSFSDGCFEIRWQRGRHFPVIIVPVDATVIENFVRDTPYHAYDFALHRVRMAGFFSLWSSCL